MATAQGPGCTEVSTTLASGLFDISLILLFTHFYSNNYTAEARTRRKEEAMLKANAKKYEEALKLVQARDRGDEKKTN
jgi:hypothetical protein